MFCCGKRIHSLALSGAAKRSATGTGRQAWLHSITYIHNRRHIHTSTHTHTVSFRRVLCNVHGQNCSKQIFINAQIEQITVFLYAHTLAHTHTRATHMLASLLIQRAAHFAGQKHSRFDFASSWSRRRVDAFIHSTAAAAAAKATTT